jgi:short-subunit dehydrogenase
MAQSGGAGKHRGAASERRRRAGNGGAMSVVITGASSGIGRATALAFAEEGANLTLAARRGGKLAEVARECERRGGRAQYLETDVTSAEAMRGLADAAIRRYGRVDVWVNDAGVGAVGRFTDVPIQAHEQTINTNLIGYIHGAHAILPHFQQRRHGTLINVVSFGAFVAPPFAAAYAASKFGLRGFSESLRGELQDYPDIHICDIFPGFVDTPGIVHGANYTGHEIHAKAPDRPETVARAIVRVAHDPRDKTSVGPIAKLVPLAYAVAPGLGRWIMARFMQVGLSRTPPQAPTPGNLFRPVPDHLPPSQRRGRATVGAGGLAALLVAVAGTALVYGRRL